MTEFTTLLNIIRRQTARLQHSRGQIGASALEFILLAVAVVGLVGVAVMFVRQKIKSEGEQL